MSHDIFISYSRRDTGRMQEVRDGLREAGLSVWTDEGIEPGTESWKKALSDAITGCTTVVVLFSPDAAQSTWVNRELDFAELHQKKLYPLLVRGEIKDAVPFGYTTYQFIDIRNDDALQNGLQELVAILSKEYSHKNLTSKSQPQIVDTSKSDEESYQAVDTDNVEIVQEQEILWKWVETPQIRFTVPHTWKVGDATEKNWARANLLMLGDETVFYRQLGFEQQAASKIIGIPGFTLERHKILTDISGLEPAGGYIAFLRHSLLPGTLFTNWMLKPYAKRFGEIILTIAPWEMVHSEWMQGSPMRIAKMEMKYLNHPPHRNGRYYIIPPPFSKTLILINIACVATRFEREMAIYDRIARSIQLLPKKR